MKRPTKKPAKMRVEPIQISVETKAGTVTVGDDILIRHPYVGSLWITVTGLPDGFVEGKYLDEWLSSRYLPDPQPIYEWVEVWFSLSCVFKIAEAA